MKRYLIILILTLIMGVLAYNNIDSLTDFNPFNGYITVPDKITETFLGSEMQLLNSSDKSNPLINLNKKKVSRSKNHRNLVFTSAGDNTKFDKLWTGDNRNYDIMAVYYGKSDGNYNKYSKSVDWILKRKGSKFQNFQFVFNNHKDIIDKYDRFFILDDDIVFDSNDINNMFKISRKYDFWICGPTFKNVPECKISHINTESQVPNNFKGTQFRYTNFVEVNVPLFNRKALDKLMNIYDPVLIGWGIDYLYIWSCDMNHKRRFALIDSITCINPQDNTKKNNKRELMNLKGANKREATWKKFADKYGIPHNWKTKTWKKVNTN